VSRLKRLVGSDNRLPSAGYCLPATVCLDLRALVLCLSNAATKERRECSSHPAVPCKREEVVVARPPSCASPLRRPARSCATLPGVARGRGPPCSPRGVAAREARSRFFLVFGGITDETPPRVTGEAVGCQLQRARRSSAKSRRNGSGLAHPSALGATTARHLGAGCTALARPGLVGAPASGRCARRGHERAPAVRCVGLRCRIRCARRLARGA
jgi:hypothetical protein